MTSLNHVDRGRDLDSETEVREFVRRFYESIGPDHPVHAYLVRSGVDLQTHEEKVAKYWLGLLGLRASLDADAVIEAHRTIHDQVPLDQVVFDRWLDTLDAVLDSGWSGPKAELVRKRSYGLARAMALRFTDLSLRDPPGYEPSGAVSDLTDRADIDRLVERFYRDVSVDSILHGYFETAGSFDWQAHMLTLGDYWHGVLFARDHDDGELIIESHRHIDAQLPFTEAAFTRWLELFNVALDHWSGPNTDRLRRHGRGMAWAMARRYVGISMPRPTRASNSSRAQRG